VRAVTLRASAAGLAALLLLAAGCGGNGGSQTTTSEVGTTTTERVVVQAGDGHFNPAAIYERAAPGVVTVVSIFGDSSSILGGSAGQGAGFVVSDDGEIVTNAHVITNGGLNDGGGDLTTAEQVYVELADRNRVGAKVIGFDPDADIALIKVDPDGLELHPLRISSRNEFAVGEPVAAIGSPFGERQSLSIGVISAADRTIASLTNFAIDNAIQTDASINPGNSGGPLLDSNGEVIGINQQIETASGTNQGVSFAIPVGALRFSLEQLRENGKVDYAFLGVSTQALWPQLAEKLGLDVDAGALVSDVVDGGPADEAGIRGSNDQLSFQGTPVETGGDVILSVDGEPVVGESDLAGLISRRRPGETVTLELLRGGDRIEVDVDLKPRPESSAS
jgi:2-alkenal reductase